MGRLREAAGPCLAIGVVLLLPAVGNGFAQALYAECAIMIVLALSYNLLLGASGMLSFGHAVYSGAGAYASIHALNWIGRSHAPLPVSLLPLAGGLAGLVAGAALGYLSTRRSGTAFAMITLGLGELVGACWLMFPGFFGGEGGISGDRTVGGKLLGVPGWNLGSDRQVDYLLAVWCCLAILGMRALLATPLGRVANAVRDNAERAGFIGYDARQVRWLMLMASAFFAGIGGGMAALDFEIVTSESVGTSRSAAMLVATVLGGTGAFHGPILGAVVYVLFAIALSQYTDAWQLYLGLVFLVLVIKAPGGLAGLASALTARGGAADWRRFSLHSAGLGGSLVLVLAGFVTLVEMTWHRTLASGDPAHLRVLWIPIDAASTSPWVASLMLCAGGALAYRWLRQRDAGAGSGSAPARTSRP